MSRHHMRIENRIALEIAQAIAFLLVIVALAFVASGCFVVAGTGNVKISGGIEQTGTEEAWTAAGGAVGVAGGTAGKIMTRP